MWETIKNNVLLKTIVVMILGVLGFGLAFNIMFGRNAGMMGQGMNGGGGYGMMPNYNYTMGVVGGFGLASMLTFLAKLLLVISVVGLATAVIFYIIKNPTSFDFSTVFNGTSKSAAKVICSQCGVDMKHDWKCCPNCGEEIGECKPKEAAPVNDAVEVKEESQLQVTADEQIAADEQVTKEDINVNSDSKGDTDVYEKLYDSASVEVEQTGHEKSRKKQSKR